MGLVKCPDCGNMVSERAAACPSCGCPADAFGTASSTSSDNVGVVHNLEVKSVSIVDNNFRLSDGTLDDTHNVFSPNYQKRGNVLDDPHNVFSPNYKRESTPDYKSQMVAAIAYPMYTVIDRKDLLIANQCIVDELKNNISVNRPITYISVENYDMAGQIVNGEFTFPYVMVTAYFRYFLDYRKFTLIKEDGTSYQQYYDLANLPSEYAPRIEVISDNKDEVKDIIDQIKGVFKEPKSYSVPYLDGNNVSQSFSCEIESVEKSKEVVDAGNTRLLHKTVVFKKVPWATYLNDEVNSVQNESMRTYRKVQLAQFYLSYASMKEDCSSQLTLYERLYLYVSKIRGFLGPAYTEEYKTLKNKIQTGQTFDSDLVDKAFPNISLIYHELPNDINSKEPVANVRKRVEDILNEYETRWTKTCVELDIPTDFTVADVNVSMRSDDGLNIILGTLEQNILSSMDDIVEDVKSKIIAAAEEQQRQEMQYQYQYEPEPQVIQESSGGSSFIGGVLRTAAGVALANKATENGKKNYMDSPNCERAKTGRKSSCWGCGLGDYCTMHDKY